MAEPLNCNKPCLKTKGEGGGGGGGRVFNKTFPKHGGNTYMRERERVYIYVCVCVSK